MTLPDQALTCDPPIEMPPALSCDCQIHVYGDPARFPVHNPKFRNRPDSFFRTHQYEDSVRMHAVLGIERSVLVQAGAYGTDHSYLLEVLSRAPRERTRAVVLIDDGVSDAEIRRLHEAGARSVRFNFAAYMGIRPTPEVFRRTIDRVREYGWTIKVNLVGRDIIELEPLLREVRDNVVLDHMGLLDGSLGIGQPAMEIILDLLRGGENWWIMLSDGNELSRATSGWDEAVAFGQAMYEAARGRAIWASDWPHLGWRHDVRPPTGAFLDLLSRYLPDAAARRKVLVDNPAHLFGF